MVEVLCLLSFYIFFCSLFLTQRSVDSPYRTTWGDLLLHTARRLGWTDPTMQLRVFFTEDLADAGEAEGSSSSSSSLGPGQHQADLLEALGSGCQVRARGQALARGTGEGREG